MNPSELPAAVAAERLHCGKGLYGVCNNVLDMYEKYVGCMVTNKSGGRQAEGDEGEERR